MEWKGKNVEELTRDELRSALSELGLPSSGDKKALLSKLHDAIGQESVQTGKGRRTTKIPLEGKDSKLKSAKSASDNIEKSLSEVEAKGRRKVSKERTIASDTAKIESETLPDTVLAEAGKPKTRRSRKDSVGSEAANSTIEESALPAAPVPATGEDDLEKRTVVDLKNMLRALQLPITGVKSVLIDRIRQHYLSSKGEAAPAPIGEIEEDSEDELDLVQDIDGMSYRELQAALKERKLDSKGTKLELAERLKNFLQDPPPRTPRAYHANVVFEPVLVRTPPVATLLSGNLQTIVKVNPNIEEEKRSERMKRRREKTEKEKGNEIVKRIKFEEPAEDVVDAEQELVEDLPPAKRRRTKSTTTTTSKSSTSSKKAAEEVKEPSKPKRKASSRESTEDIEVGLRGPVRDLEENKDFDAAKKGEEPKSEPESTKPPASPKVPKARRTRNVVSIVDEKPSIATEPAVEIQAKPSVVGEKPKVAKKAPVETKEKSSVVGEKPKVAKKAPVETKEKSSVVVEKREVAKKEPVKTQKKPPVVGEKPKVAKKEPVETQEKPSVVVEKREVAKEEPEPVKIQEKPRAVVGKPKVANKEPVETQEKPSVVVEKPSVVVEKREVAKEEPEPVKIQEKPPRAVVGKPKVAKEEPIETQETPRLASITDKAETPEDSKNAPSTKSSLSTTQLEATEAKPEIKKIDGMGNAKGVKEHIKQDAVKVNEVTKPEQTIAEPKKAVKESAASAVAVFGATGSDLNANETKVKGEAEPVEKREALQEPVVPVKLVQEPSSSLSKPEQPSGAQLEKQKQTQIPETKTPIAEKPEEVIQKATNQVVDRQLEEGVNSPEASKAMLKLGETSVPVVTSKAIEPPIPAPESFASKVDESNHGVTQFVSAVWADQSSMEIVAESKETEEPPVEQRSDLMEVEEAAQSSLPKVVESQLGNSDVVAPIVQDIVDHIVSNATVIDNVQAQAEPKPSLASESASSPWTEPKPAPIDSAQATLSISAVLRGSNSVDRAEEIYKLITKSLDASAASRGSHRYSSSGLSFETANENSAQEEGSSPSVASSNPATSPEPESRLPLAVTALESDPESLLQRDEELFTQLEAALIDATRAGITMAEFEVLDAVLQSFVPMSQSTSQYPTTPSTIGQRGRGLDDSFMQYTQPRIEHPTSNLAYAPTPIMPPAYSKPAYSGWRNSAAKAQRPPVPLFSPQPTPVATPAAFNRSQKKSNPHHQSAVKPVAKSAVAERILNVLREEHVPLTKFVFTPAPRVFGVSPLVRTDLISRVSGATTLEFGFDK